MQAHAAATPEPSPTPTSATPLNDRGLRFTRRFTQSGVDPFDGVTWVLRDAVITDADGKVYFEQRQVEFPVTWSQAAVAVVAQKYFRGAPGSAARERSVKQMISRVADTIAGWGRQGGYFVTAEDESAFRDELVHLLLHQKMAFNSPVWFNVGIHPEPQASACYINSVDDSLAGILTLVKTEGLLFKHGSGTGSNLSGLRGAGEALHNGGTASGPVSFMRGFDAFAGAIKSGGKTRRAAKMVILNADHPDIVEFIECKATEEKKAWALIDAGYNGAFNVAGGAYDSVGFQNANHSVRVSDDFMQAATRDADWQTRAVVDGRVVRTFKAKDILRKMAEAAWVCGDPGIQFDTTTNAWHTCPASGRINASNPCSEFVFLDDTACNLASLNLRKFQHANGDFDTDNFRAACAITITAMEILVGNASYPTPKIARNSQDFRPLGLGYANLGALLMARGLAYDSAAGRDYAAAITSLMGAAAYAQSARIAGVLGAFSKYPLNASAMYAVVERHADANRQLLTSASDDTHAVATAAREAWADACARGTKYGFRNSQVTVLAPTGTIAFLMDCDTTGIEPDIALVKYKRLVGGGLLKTTNHTVPEALTKLGYDAKQVEAIVAHIAANDTIEGAPGLKDEHLPVFDCAFRSASGTRSIHYMGHLRMMAAAQPFLSGAISKTVNLPNDCTVEDIEDAYIQAWKMGLKAIAVYRDGCKRTQPLSTSAAKAPSATAATPATAELTAAGPPPPRRHKLTRDRHSVTHKFAIGAHEGYITVGLYADGTPGEIFVRMAKEGSTIAGLVDSFATAVSIALQHGAPLALLVDKFKGTRFEPSGFTGNQEIPIATSIMDYVFRWLELFVTRPAPTLPPMPAFTTPSTVAQAAATDAPPCHECGALMVRNGACHRCLNCGSTSGCS